MAKPFASTSDIETSLECCPNLACLMGFGIRDEDVRRIQEPLQLRILHNGKVRTRVNVWVVRQFNENWPTLSIWVVDQNPPRRSGPVTDKFYGVTCILLRSFYQITDTSFLNLRRGCC